MSDHSRKGPGEDLGHVTIPPSLQGFSGRREKPQVQRRGQDEALATAFGQLEGVAGAAAAVDAVEQDLTRGAGNASTYVGVVHVPAAALGVRQTGKVKIHEAGAGGVRESRWASEGGTTELAAASELPSALAPSTRTEPAPAREKAAAAEGNLGVRVMGVLAVVAVIGFAAFQLVPRAVPQEEAEAVPVRSAAAAMVSAAGAVVVSGAAVVAAPPQAVGAMVVDAGAGVGPSVPALPGKGKGKGKGGRIEDLYNAAVPRAAKTVEVVVPPPPTAAPSPAGSSWF